MFCIIYAPKGCLSYGIFVIMTQISTQEILRTDRDIETFMTEDMTFTARQNVRHVCVALKKYFEAHLGIKADEIRREQTNEYISPVSESSAYKVEAPITIQ